MAVAATVRPGCKPTSDSGGPPCGNPTKSGLGVMGHSRVQLGLSIKIDRKMIRVVET